MIIVAHLPDAIFDSISLLRTSTLLSWQLQAVQVPPSWPETVEIIAMIANTKIKNNWGHHQTTERAELWTCTKFFNTSLLLPQLQICFRALSSLIVWSKQDMWLITMNVHDSIIMPSPFAMFLYGIHVQVAFHPPSTVFMIHVSWIMKMVDVKLSRNSTSTWN